MIAICNLCEVVIMKLINGNTKEGGYVKSCDILYFISPFDFGHALVCCLSTAVKSYLNIFYGKYHKKGQVFDNIHRLPHSRNGLAPSSLPLCAWVYEVNKGCCQGKDTLIIKRYMFF